MAKRIWLIGIDHHHFFRVETTRNSVKERKFQRTQAEIIDQVGKLKVDLPYLPSEPLFSGRKRIRLIEPVLCELRDCLSLPTTWQTASALSKRRHWRRSIPTLQTRFLLALLLQRRVRRLLQSLRRSRMNLTVEMAHFCREMKIFFRTLRRKRASLTIQVQIAR